MKRYLLDTSALLTLRDDEPGADRVAELLTLARAGRSECFGCFMTLMEILYRVSRDESEARGHEAYSQCLQLPIEWQHETPALLKAAAKVKSRTSLSVADAWIAACADGLAATLVHKDPEFETLELAQECLPFKAKQKRR
jgi:predicted nucleic acid-binding protein